MAFTAPFTPPFSLSNKWIPRSFRQPQHSAGLAAYYGNLLSADRKDAKGYNIDYISGALKLQDLLAGRVPGQEAKTYSTDTILDIRLFPRLSAENNIVGTKARIYYEGTDFRTKKESIESIDTDFLSCKMYLWDEHQLFNSALAHTLVTEAFMALTHGAGAMLTKASKDDESGKARWLVNCYARPWLHEPTLMKDVVESPEPDQWSTFIFHDMVNLDTTDQEAIADQIASTFTIDTDLADEIVHRSNAQSANLNPNNTDFDKAPGISLKIAYDLIEGQ